MKERTTKLAAPADCRLAIEAAAISDPVTVERPENGGGSLIFLDAQGRLLGRVTARHQAAQCLAAGDVVLHCSVNSITMQSASYPYGAVNVRIVTGRVDEHFEMPPTRSYPLGIVGESHYQPAIARCRVGDRVVFTLEFDNPYDRKAIVAKSVDGSTLGYVPRDSWLRGAIHEERRGVSATVLSLHPGPPIAVVLDVIPGGAAVGVSAYVPPPAGQRTEARSDIAATVVETLVRRGWLGRLFGR